MAERKLASWIEGFFEFTQHLPSPPIFRRWAALATVAGVLERRVYVRSFNTPLYPNVYVLLIAPPGVGKTVLTNEVRRFWAAVPEMKVASASVTRASLIDELAESERIVTNAGPGQPQLRYHSLLLGVNELGVFLPSYDSEFMSVLTDLYDGHGYSETRRSSKIAHNFDAVVLNMLAATTPSYIGKMLPEGAWDQGFLSRVINVYSGERTIRPLFDTKTENTALRKDLESDLREIAKLTGRIEFEPDAVATIEEWHANGGEPAPTHPKLLHYNTRRSAHLLKLCQVICCAEGDTRTVTLAHLQKALDMLTEAETFMPDIFKAMSAKGEGETIQEAYHYVYTYWIKTKKPMPEFKLVNFLSERTPVHNVDRMIDVMTRAQLLSKEHVPKVGPAYKPEALKAD